MAKDKKEQLIHVARPKIGERYYFRFAGSLMFGPILSRNDNLEKTYGYAWFWMNSDVDPHGSKSTYPVPIYKISKNMKDV